MYVQGSREEKNGSHDLSRIFARYLREEDAKHKKLFYILLSVMAKY